MLSKNKEMTNKNNIKPVIEKGISVSISEFKKHVDANSIVDILIEGKEDGFYLYGISTGSNLRFELQTTRGHQRAWKSLDTLVGKLKTLGFKQASIRLN